MKPENLIARIRNGDEEAFEQVYKEYYSRLYSYVFGYMRNREDSREIIQNTFFSLWNKKAELNDDTKIGAWLFTVVKNQCLNQIRDTMNRLNLLTESEYLENERLKWQKISLQSFIPEELALSELQQIIDEATDKLPEQCKRIFILSRYEGLSHKEIGEQLNISTKTIENQITKALKLLRKCLSDYQYFLFQVML